MKGRIIILGAAGQLGRAAARAFSAAGWQVGSLVRGTSARRAVPGTELIEVDARDRGAVVAAASGADAVLHALNIPYTQWADFAGPFAETAIQAAQQNGAALVFPGNLYGYGQDMPAVLDELTPMRPTTRKGALRLEIEKRIQAATVDGLRAVILRSGDFFGGDDTGSWFDRIIIRDFGARRLMYPGPFDVQHEWAFLPDMADAMVRLVEARAGLEPFARFGFAGHAVTGHDLFAAISRASGREFKVAQMPWRVLKALGIVIPVFRELSELAYLWSTPHRIDGARLAGVIGDLRHTPLDQAVAAALAEFGVRRGPVRKA